MTGSDRLWVLGVVFLGVGVSTLVAGGDDPTLLFGLAFALLGLGTMLLLGGPRRP